VNIVVPTLVAKSLSNVIGNLLIGLKTYALFKVGQLVLDILNPVSDYTVHIVSLLYTHDAGVKMTAFRRSPDDPIQCPMLSCHETAINFKELSKHIEKVHTEQHEGAAIPAASLDGPPPARMSISSLPGSNKASPTPEDFGQVLVPDTPPVPPTLLSVQTAKTQSCSDISDPGSPTPLSITNASLMPDHLDGSRSYLKSNELFNLMGIHYHTHYKVLICDCGQAVLHHSCITHICGHGIKLNKHQQDSYSNIIQDLTLVGSTKEIASPLPGGPPVELLTHYPDGFCCNLCSYCAPNKSTMDNHWYKYHVEEEASGPDRYHRGTLQTFFKPVGQHYFEVNPDLSSLPTDDMFTIYTRDEVAKYAPFPASSATNVCDIPLLLQVTQWHEHVAAYISDHHQRDALRSLVKLPGRHSHVGLGRLGNIIFEYLKVIRDQARSSSIDMRRLLIECPLLVFSVLSSCQSI
jgi:hypothetical protein